MDGWNEEKVSSVIDVCDEIYQLSYELQHCRRGCYTNSMTYEELAEYIKELGERLISEGEYVERLEEDEEDDDE